MKYWNEKEKKLMTEEEMSKSAEVSTDDNSNDAEVSTDDGQEATSPEQEQEETKKGRSRK